MVINVNVIGINIIIIIKVNTGLLIIDSSSVNTVILNILASSSNSSGSSSHLYSTCWWNSPLVISLVSIDGIPSLGCTEIGID